VSTRCSDKDTFLYSGNPNKFQSQASQPNDYFDSIVSNDIEKKQTQENWKISNAKTNGNFNSNRRRLPSSLKRSASTVSDIQFMRRGNLKQSFDLETCSTSLNRLYYFTV
jgi:hypothetical protein